MRLSIQVGLCPTVEQIPLLEETLTRFNASATWLAARAFEGRCVNKYAMQQRHYRDLRERFGLSAQMAVRCIAQVCEAYKRDRTLQPTFRQYAAMPFDQRILSHNRDCVSLLTLQGRITIPFLCSVAQAVRLRAAWGQADLLRRRDGRWFLCIAVEIEEEPASPPSAFIGVDIGIVNIATTCEGSIYTGGEIERHRRTYAERRRRLQIKAAAHKKARKRPKAVRRALKRLACKEARFRKDINHCIAKAIVRRAKDTARGIAIERLTHIRTRTRFRKAQRAQASSWSFAQLRHFIEYKAAMAGVLAFVVSARNTSRQCFACKYVDKRNRRSQAIFECERCAHSDHADRNAAKNIAYRAEVSLPIVSWIVLMREPTGTSLGLHN